MDPEDRPTEEEDSYRKVDLRSSARPEADAADETPPEPEPEPDTLDADTTPAPAEEPVIDTVGVLRLTAGLLVEQAWVQMGVQLAPGAKEIVADLRQARLAIDTLQYLREALAADLAPEECKYLDQTLSTLRLNFVQRS
jgi:hypothetical protein